MQKHVSVVYCCALCISVIFAIVNHTSDGWRYATTYRWIKVYKPLFSTYVHTHAYMSFCSDTQVFGEVSCMNLHSTVYIRIQLPGKPSFSKNLLWKMGTFYGDVLTNLFFVFGDVLTNSGTFWLGGVLTRGRFDLHPFGIMRLAEWWQTAILIDGQVFLSHPYTNNGFMNMLRMDTIMMTHTTLTWQWCHLTVMFLSIPGLTLAL